MFKRGHYNAYHVAPTSYARPVLNCSDSAGRCYIVADKWMRLVARPLGNAQRPTRVAKLAATATRFEPGGTSLHQYFVDALDLVL